MIKRRIAGAAGLLLLTAICALAADPQPTPMPGTSVHDFAGVISAEKRDEINAKAKALKDTYKTEIGLVTIQSLNGEDIFDYSLRMGRDWGIGSKDNEIRGLLIVVSVGDRKIGFRTSRHIEGEITDGMAGTINRAMGQYFKKGDWGGGLSAGMDMILAREKEAFEPAPAAAAKPATSGGPGLGTFLLMLFGFGFVAFVLVAIVRRSRRRARVNVPRPAYTVPDRYSSPVRPRPPSYGSRPSSRRTQREEYIPIPIATPDPEPEESSSRSSSYRSSSSDDDSSSSNSYSSPSDSGGGYGGGGDFGGGGADSSF